MLEPNFILFYRIQTKIKQRFQEHQPVCKQTPFIKNVRTTSHVAYINIFPSSEFLFSDRINVAIISAVSFCSDTAASLCRKSIIFCSLHAIDQRGKLSCSCTILLVALAAEIFAKFRLLPFCEQKATTIFYIPSFPAVLRFFTSRDRQHLNSICPAGKFSAARRPHQFQMPSAFCMLYIRKIHICTHIRLCFSRTHRDKMLHFFYESAIPLELQSLLLRSKADCSSAQFEYWVRLKLSIFHISRPSQ